MNRLSHPLLVAVGFTLGLSAAPAAAEVIFNDTFTDGTTAGYFLPTSGGASISVEADPPSGLDGNAILLSTTSNARTLARSFGPPITLASVGDFIELDFDYRVTVSIDDRDGISAFLTGSGGAEAGMRFNPTAGGNDGIYFTDGDTNASRFDTIDSGTTAQNAVIRVTRFSATEVQLLAAFNGSARDISDLQVIGTQIATDVTFDGIELGWSSGAAGDIFFDNVSVNTNIPEPSSLILAALGTSMLIVRRRSA